MSATPPTQVTVRFFASLREAVGRDSIALHVDEPCIAGVKAGLASFFGAAELDAISAPGVRVCVNRTIIRGNAGLASGDEVAFLPPVTGG